MFRAVTNAGDVLTPTHWLQMCRMIGITCSRPLTASHHFQLLYDAEKDGASAADFHRLCDGKGPNPSSHDSVGALAVVRGAGPTLVVLEVHPAREPRSKKPFVVGGYTPIAWSSPFPAFRGSSEDTMSSFIYQLFNGEELSPRTARYALRQDPHRTYYLHGSSFTFPACADYHTKSAASSGPGFGMTDLAVSFPSPSMGTMAVVDLSGLGNMYKVPWEKKTPHFPRRMYVLRMEVFLVR